MHKILLISLLSLTSIEALSCNEDLTNLGDYWATKTEKRVRRPSERAAAANSLQSIFAEAEDRYNHRDFVNAHRNYFKLYKKIIKDDAQHDFKNSQLADIYEGLALSSWVVSSKDKPRAYSVAIRALRKAIKLHLPDRRKEALRFSLNFMKTQRALTMQ